MKHKQTSLFLTRQHQLCCWNEIENEEYLDKNPKQKNFTGKLRGIQENKVCLEMSDLPGCEVRIPHDLISKAHLEFDPDRDERKTR